MHSIWVCGGYDAFEVIHPDSGSDKFPPRGELDNSDGKVTGYALRHSLVANIKMGNLPHRQMMQ